MADTAPLLVDTRDGVTTLTLNRPAQYNALSGELLAALSAALDRVADDGNTRAVVIAAAGKAFCAGHDLTELRAHEDRGRHRELFTACSEMMLRIVHLPQPVIARVQGTATAAGCQLVATCDLAVSSDQARYAVSGIRVGLFCSTPAVALSRNVSRKRALEMLLTGEFIDAGTALDYGLVNRVVPDDELAAATDELVSRIIRHPRRVLALGKEMFYRQLNDTLPGAYRGATETIADNLMLPETREGLDAFIAKRAPDWERAEAQAD